MKYTWEPDDIECGRRVIAYNDTEQYMIGYETSSRDGYLLLSGRDGMVRRIGKTKEGAAESLNNSGHKPLTTDPFDRPPLAST